MNYSVVYHVFPAIFYVISRKVDYLWREIQQLQYEPVFEICKKGNIPSPSEI